MTLLAGTGALLYPKGVYVLATFVVAQIGVLVLLQFPDMIEQWVLAPLSKFDTFSGWIEPFRTFYERSSQLLSLPNLLAGTGLGVLAWGFEGVALWFILRDLGIMNLSLPLSVFVFAMSVLIGTAAMLPDGIGSSEALMIGMLIVFGVPNGIAVTATILVRLVTLWYGVVLSIICWTLTWYCTAKL